MDKLDVLVELQKKLMERLKVQSFTDNEPIVSAPGIVASKLTVIEEQTKNMLHAITCEIGEISDEINWKPWKSTRRDIKLHDLRLELIDVFHFILEIMIMWGMDAQVIHDYYIIKNQENHERQDRKY